MLTLPFLREDAVCNAQRFAEPWDGPNNRKLKHRLSRNCVCPHSEGARDTDRIGTNYVAVAGPETMWPGSRGRRLDEILDGAENTILRMEIEPSDIHWMEPRDLSLEEALGLVDPAAVPVPDKPHPVGEGCFSLGHSARCVAMADGSVKLLPASMARDDFEPLFTVNGGEWRHDVDWGFPGRVNWSRIASLGLLFVSSLLVVVRAAGRGFASRIGIMLETGSILQTGDGTDE